MKITDSESEVLQLFTIIYDQHHKILQLTVNYLQLHTMKLTSGMVCIVMWA
jgi:hypothetical protein